MASGIENGSLAGSAGNASLNGNDGNNKLTGNDGANVLTGGEGDDTLDGGAGDDVLIGGEGGDTYYVDSVDDEVYGEPELVLCVPYVPKHEHCPDAPSLRALSQQDESDEDVPAKPSPFAVLARLKKD